jgi:hypothetical protein
MNWERQYGRDDVNYQTWYSDWAKLMARTYSVVELERMAGSASHDASRAARTHLQAIQRTSSMQSNSAARAHSRNVLAAAGETARTARAAIEIHELFPEFAKHAGSTGEDRTG